MQLWCGASLPSPAPSPGGACHGRSDPPQGLFLEAACVPRAEGVAPPPAFATRAETVAKEEAEAPPVDWRSSEVDPEYAHLPHELGIHLSRLKARRTFPPPSPHPHPRHIIWKSRTSEPAT